MHLIHTGFSRKQKNPKADPELKTFLLISKFLEIRKVGSQDAERYWSILKLLLAPKKPDRENKVAAVFLITETNIIILSSHWNTFQNTANY